MKKFKFLSVLLILSLIFTMPVVYAHDITVDKENVKIEDVDGNIYSGSKVIVAQSIGEYELYYQYVQMENDVYRAYDKKIKESEDYRKEFLEDNNLTDINDASDELIDSYNAAIDGYMEEIEELLPVYVEDAWIKSTDNTAKLDLTRVPENALGMQPYVLWLKVVPKNDSENPIYNDRVVLAKRQVEDSELKEDNAQTGDGIIWVGIATVALAGIMVVSYKKSNA